MFRHKLYELREDRDMKPETFASLVSAMLYEKRLVTSICSLTCVNVYFLMITWCQSHNCMFLNMNSIFGELMRVVN